MRHLLVAFLLYIPIIGSSQAFKDIYLGKDYKLYKGVHLTLNEEGPKILSRIFYNDLGSSQASYNSNVVFPDPAHQDRTVRDSLLGKIFIVDSIVEDKSIKYSSIPGTPIFILKDTLSKQIIYFKYDQQFEHTFPFLTSKITYNEKELCDRLDRIVDDFTNDITIYSPLDNVSITKVIAKGIASYYLREPRITP